MPLPPLGTKGESTRTVILSIGDLDLNGIRNIARPFADDVRQFTADILRSPPQNAERLIVVRRIMLTAEQVEQHVGERARVDVRNSTEHIKAAWPYPFTAQAEALAPELRDTIVADAIDALHDVALRDSVIAGEALVAQAGAGGTSGEARWEGGVNGEPTPDGVTARRSLSTRASAADPAATRDGAGREALHRSAGRVASGRPGRNNIAGTGYAPYGERWLMKRAPSSDE